MVSKVQKNSPLKIQTAIIEAISNLILSPQQQHYFFCHDKQI
jgi:hypothetical protein